MAADEGAPDLATWLRARGSLVGRAWTVGLAVGGVAFVALLATGGDPTTASNRSFAVGALLFSLGLLGWSGSVMAGRGVEAMQRHLSTGTDWTEADSRRAMARVGGFGFGWMVGASMATVVLG